MNIWNKLKASIFSKTRCGIMSTQYDSLAREILKDFDVSADTPDIIALAKKYSIEVLSRKSYLTRKNEPAFSFYTSSLKWNFSGKQQAELNPNMKYHLLLSTPSPSECREWIAYCIVLVFFFEKRYISSYFLANAMAGNSSLRNDTFHRYATSILIPEEKLHRWGYVENKYPSRFNKWDDVARQETAIHFAVPREVVDVRLSLYDSAGMLLTPELMDNGASQVENEG